MTNGENMDYNTALEFMRKYEYGKLLEEGDEEAARFLSRCDRIHMFGSTVVPTTRGNVELQDVEEGKPGFCDYCINEFLKGLSDASNRGARVKLPDDAEKVKVVYPVMCDVVFDAARKYLEGLPDTTVLMDTSNTNLLIVSFPNGQKEYIEKGLPR